MPRRPAVSFVRLEDRTTPALPTFVPGPLAPLGDSFAAAAVGDFDARDGNGYADLAIAGVTNSKLSVTVWTGDGLGNFAANPPFVVGSTSVSSAPLAAADFDLDGNPDVVVGGGSGRVLYGDGAGGLVAGGVLETSSIDRVAVGDFDGVNGPDVLLERDFEGSSFAYFVARSGPAGSRTFGPTADGLGVSGTFGGPVVIGDFDRDGAGDFAIAGRTGLDALRVEIYAGDGAGGFGFVPQTTVPPPTLTVVSDLLAGQFAPGKGVDLLAFGNKTAAATGLQQFENLTPQAVGVAFTSALFVGHPPGVTSQTLAGAAADFNGDGRPDAVALDVSGFNGSGDPVSYENTAAGFVQSASYPFTGTPKAILTGDFNASGRPDFVVIGRNDAGLPVGTVYLDALLDSFAVAAVTPNPANLNDTLTFTATVARAFTIPDPGGNQRILPQSALIPEGVVQFAVNGVFVGQPVPLDAVGRATLAVPASAAGAFTLTANYTFVPNGTPAYAPSASPPVPFFVNPATSTVALTADPNPIFPGDITFLTAVVGPAGATGTVTFRDGSITGTVLGTATLDAVGAATVPVLLPAVGSFPIVAVYAGDANFTPATSNVVTVVVNRRPAAVTLTAAPNPVTAGGAVTLTAAVTAGATGTVTFTEGTMSLGTGTVDAAGRATLAVPGFAAGSHVVTAAYSGDARYAPATGTVTVVADMIPTSTRLTAPPAVAFGESVPLVAVVTDADGSAVAGAVVAFREGATLLGTAVADAAGTATFSAAGVGVGGHTFTAAYAGGGAFAGSVSPPATVTVGRAAATTTTITADPNPAPFGTPVRVTVRVTASAGTPTGTVVVMPADAPPVVLTLDADGTATTTLLLPVGTRDVAAGYAGDANFPGSVAAPAAVTVEPAATAANLSASLTAVRVGDAVRLTARVTGVIGATPPGGTVTFFDANNPLGIVPLAADGTAVLDTAALPVGVRSPSVRYAGDANYTGSAAAAAVTVNDRAVFLAGTDRGPVVCIYDGGGSLRHGVQSFGPAFAGGVRPLAIDVNADGVADFLAGSGPGTVSRVVVLDGATEKELFAFDPFERTFTGGVYVAAADVNGDGRPDIAVSAGGGGGPRVRLYLSSPTGYAPGADFFALADANFRGGTRITMADFDGDGRAELVAAAGSDGGPRVVVFAGSSLAAGTPVAAADFYGFDATDRGGAYAAAADVTGDGVPDLVLGSGAGPRVRVFDRFGGNVIADFAAGADAGAATVAARDLNGDGRADVITGAGTGGRVRAFMSIASGTTTTVDTIAFAGLISGVNAG